MKDKLSNFRLSSFIGNFIICIIYPIVKTIVSDNKLLVLSDTLFIMSLVFIIGGIINSLILHGDFDITSFIARRSLSKDSNLTFEKYKKDKQDERKGSFNYPLLVGIIVLIISYIISIYA